MCKIIFNIYVLKLIHNKYYIGKTLYNISKRITQHSNGIGAEWTKKYKPIDIIEFIQTSDKFDEDKYTKKYMDIYGIENVRGGSYTKIKLYDYQIKVLNLELKTANNLCFKCGKYGHFISNCI
jgi:hypothetical protein